MSAVTQRALAWTACAADAHQTLDAMNRVARNDPQRAEVISRLALDLSYLCTLGDANGICSLFDSIDFEYNGAGALIDWFAH